MRMLAQLLLRLRSRRLSAEARRRRRALAELIRRESADIAALEREARRAHKLAVAKRVPAERRRRLPPMPLPTLPTLTATEARA